ncbi:MAG: hypothetical protein ACYDCQ_19025 [Dehalococcoidia bacterium]
MAGPYWVFFDFVNAKGENEISARLRTWPDAVWVMLDTRLDYLATQRIHEDRNWIAKLDDTHDRYCADLYEIRLRVKGVQYRPIAYRGPAPYGQFTLLFGAREKGNQFDPRAACRIAKSKIDDIVAERGKVVEHKTFGAPPADRADDDE